MAWGFKVQSGFKNKPKHVGIQRKMLQLQIQPEVVCQDSNLMAIKVPPEVGFWNGDVPAVMTRTRCIPGVCLVHV